MALQQSKAGENEEVGGGRAEIGRIRFTFLSRDVISRQGQSKASTTEANSSSSSSSSSSSKSNSGALFLVLLLDTLVPVR